MKECEMDRRDLLRTLTGGTLAGAGLLASRTASEALAQDSYTLANAFVSVRTDDDRWELRAGAQNLTDEKVRVQGFNLSEFPGYQLAFYSARRTWNLHVAYRY
jgi:iron complex outermembrane receptor protein